MSLDINICSYKRDKCPHCGEEIKGERNEDIFVGGYRLRTMLNLIGYGEDQYGKCIQLTPQEAQIVARQLFDTNHTDEFDALQHAIYSDDIIELEASW